MSDDADDLGGAEGVGAVHEGGACQAISLSSQISRDPRFLSAALELRQFAVW